LILWLAITQDQGVDGAIYQLHWHCQSGK